MREAVHALRYNTMLGQLVREQIYSPLSNLYEHHTQRHSQSRVTIGGFRRATYLFGSLVSRCPSVLCDERFQRRLVRDAFILVADGDGDSCDLL